MTLIYIDTELYQKKTNVSSIFIHRLSFLKFNNISLRFAHLDIIPKSLKSHFQLQRHNYFPPETALFTELLEI